MVADLLANLAIGLSTAFSPMNLLFCAIGVTLGTLLGVIPGVGTLAAISMLFPITFHVDPTTALVMMGGIYYGTSYGGSTASILLNVPGTPSSAVTCLDGYPMARQGRAGVALLMTTVGSFVGASIGIIIMTLFSPIISQYALKFGSAEYFTVILAGLIAASAVSSGVPLKAIAMTALGIFFGLVGTDPHTGGSRFTFGFMELADGISIVAVAMGIFGVAEIIASTRNPGGGSRKNAVTLRSMLPTRDDLRRSAMPMLRGTGIGAFFGVLPGVGGTMAAFIAYATEKRLAKDPSRFGNGAIEGVVAPESANNASDQTAFIPTLTLGVPGTATMALILSVLMIHGISPGPTLVTTRPDLFWGLVMSFWVGNVLLLILNIPMIGVWVRLLSIPYHALYPAILIFVCIGAFSVRSSVFDVVSVAAFGALGYGMRLLQLPPAPLLLGFVLGPMLEAYFRRSMVISKGSLDIFVERPISLAFMLMSLAMLLWIGWGTWRAWRARSEATGASGEGMQG